LTKNLHFVIYIASKDETQVQHMSTSLHEKKTWWRQWTLIFSVDVHIWSRVSWSPPLVCMRPPEPDPSALA